MTTTHAAQLNWKQKIGCSTFVTNSGYPASETVETITESVSRLQEIQYRNLKAKIDGKTKPTDRRDVGGTSTTNR
jgi:hypothetical protein